MGLFGLFQMIHAVIDLVIWEFQIFFFFFLKVSRYYKSMERQGVYHGIVVD